jgi:hypothetical protein
LEGQPHSEFVDHVLLGVKIQIYLLNKETKMINQHKLYAACTQLHFGILAVHKNVSIVVELKNFFARDEHLSSASLVHRLKSNFRATNFGKVLLYHLIPDLQHAPTTPPVTSATNIPLQKFQKNNVTLSLHYISLNDISQKSTTLGTLGRAVRGHLGSNPMPANPNPSSLPTIFTCINNTT